MTGEWIAVIGSVVAALIAGGFGIYHLQRSTTAERELELEKLATARKDAELAQQRESLRQFRQAQILPFLKHLDQALNASYTAAYVPEHFPELGGYVPQIREYGDKGMQPWFEALGRMSEQRMQMLLAVEPAKIAPLADSLMRFVEQMERLRETRHRLWFRKATQAELWEAHREYIRIGYEIMIDVRNAAIHGPLYETPVTEAERREIAEKLALPLERLSTATLPYGSRRDYTWVALWQADRSPEWEAFVARMTRTSHAEFEQQLKALVGELHARADVLETSMMRVDGDQTQIYCVAVKFPSPDGLRAFVAADLPKLRGAYPGLWSGHRSPIEFDLGAPGETAPVPGNREGAIGADPEPADDD